MLYNSGLKVGNPKQIDDPCTSPFLAPCQTINKTFSAFAEQNANLCLAVCVCVAVPMCVCVSLCVCDLVPLFALLSAVLKYKQKIGQNSNLLTFLHKLSKGNNKQNIPPALSLFLSQIFAIGTCLSIIFTYIYILCTLPHTIHI